MAKRVNYNLIGWHEIDGGLGNGNVVTLKHISINLNTKQVKTMAKSRETFNKKETEKNKEKKRKEKEQRKEERKANSKSSSSNWEDMMAYVDENGNISSTPPDPTKKRVIKEEDIEIGVPKQSNVKVDPMRKGKVTFYNDSKGYGFIKDQDSQESIFVHVNSVIDAIKENDKVTFEVEMGQKGPNAVRVKVVK